MSDELPPLPRFLDRKQWSSEAWERTAKKQKEAHAQIQAELDALQARACALKEAKKVKEALDAQRAVERAETEARREAKRVLRNACLAFIRRSLDRGPQTTNQMRQNATEGTKDLVPWGLRTMLKTGEIEKVSRQTYRRKR